jgi:hypothetical protein
MLADPAGLSPFVLRVGVGGEMRPLIWWISVILAAAAIDLFARFGIPFDLTRVLWIESAVFSLSGLGLLLLSGRSPRARGLRRRMQIVLVAGFFLGGLRSGLWAAGFPIGRVDLLVLGTAILLWLGLHLARLRQRPVLASKDSEPPV